MGNHPSAYEGWIKEEFDKHCKPNQEYLTLEELMRFECPSEHVIDPTHLGTLFVLDQDKNGQFYFNEIMKFAALYSERQANNFGATDFAKDFQGFCTLILWRTVSMPKGNLAFVDWFVNLFSHGSTVKIAGELDMFLNRGSIKLLHSLLQIEKGFGLDYIAFFDLMQQLGEEMKLMTLDNVKYDDLVPLKVLKKFAKEFINGFIEFILQLGFERDMEIPSI